MNVLSLFAGIGGLELGLEWAGMTTVGQVELDETCRQVLARHWPEVPRHDDVRTAAAWWASEHRPPVNVVCGGFPCQPFSTAGLRRGVTDERSAPDDSDGGHAVSIPAARVGTRDPAPTASRATCPRCGVRRQVNRGDNRLCGSCSDEVADLHETEVWR